MRYGKPRRNRAIPDLSKPIIPDDNATLERRKRKQKWWQWLNATLSCVCLALFLTILLILFIIFSNVDHQEDSTSSHPIDIFHSNNQSTTSFDSSNTSKPVTPPPWILYPIQFYLCYKCNFFEQNTGCPSTFGIAWIMFFKPLKSLRAKRVSFLENMYFCT